MSFRSPVYSFYDSLMKRTFNFLTSFCELYLRLGIMSFSARFIIGREFLGFFVNNPLYSFVTTKSYKRAISLSIFLNYVLSAVVFCLAAAAISFVVYLVFDDSSVFFSVFLFAALFYLSTRHNFRYMLHLYGQSPVIPQYSDDERATLLLRLHYMFDKYKVKKRNLPSFSPNVPSLSKISLEQENHIFRDLMAGMSDSGYALSGAHIMIELNFMGRKFKFFTVEGIPKE